MKLLKPSLFSGIMIAPLLMLFSCKKLPETDFTYAPAENPEAGEFIQFENTTPEASSFDWNFGDGGTSTQESPSHKFDDPGDYMVELIASNDAGDQPKSITLTINDPTILAFFILDSSAQNILEGADVWVYDNETDWNNIAEPMLSVLTNADGEASFSNMEAIVYYAWIFKEAEGGLWVSGGYTAALVQNEENWFTVPCAWLPNEETKTSPDYPDPVKLIRR
jgi:PKD repeat protein